MLKSLLLITAFVQIIPFTIGILYFKRLSFVEARAFLLYMGINMLAEAFAHYLASHHKNNLFVYNISDFIFALFVTLSIWKKPGVPSKIVSIVFLFSIATTFILQGITNYNPYTYLILYAVIVFVSLARLQFIILKKLGDIQQMWFYMAFLAKGVLCINLYYLYYYLLEIRSEGILPYYISFNFTSSIVFAILLSITYSCRNQKNIF